MRLAATIVLVIGVGMLGAAPAGAAPVVTTLLETPGAAGTTEFTGTPSLEDGRPQAIDSWSRIPGADAIAVHFASGVPECHAVHAEVSETPDIVAVKLRSGVPPGSEDRVCVALGVLGSLIVPLGAPVGDRAVVSIT